MTMRRADQGFVLINVLVLVLALSFVAMQLMRDTTRTTETVAIARTADRAALLADAGVAFVADLLARDLAATQTDHGGEPWALDQFAVQAGDDIVTVTVRDLDARFNLNLLISDEPGVPEKVLLALATATAAPSELASLLIARYAPYQPSAAQVENEAAKKMFQDGDLTHIGTVAAFAGPEAAALRDHVATLPRGRRTNINTASPEVLTALLGIEPNVATSLIALRDRSPFESPAQFAATVDTLAGAQVAAALPLDLLDFTSAWFQVETTVRLDGLTHRSRTVLFRDPEGASLRVFARQTEVTG